MMQKFIMAMAMTAIFLPGVAQQRNGALRQPQQGREEAAEKMREAARVYYANADTAEYGVRYRLNYLYNKERNLRYEEDRVALVHPKVTLYMSYEGFGEKRWRLNNPESKGGDKSLAYHLTPSYYFFYPESGRTVSTYRILSEEFLLDDSTNETQWSISDEQKRIGDYNCRKATCEKGGRRWTAWFTNDLPYVAAPRTLNGLPGVVLEVADDDGEVSWTFNGIVKNMEGDTLYIKYPDKFTDIPVENFSKVLKIVALTDDNQLQKSGVLNKSQDYYPEKYRPATGIDACEVTNPIER
jgi:GLPGLI family protein